jgi:putative membrane protein
MPRLFIYNTEAEEKDEVSRRVLHAQFHIMMRRLWYGITFPSAIITLMIGPYLMFSYGWNRILFQDAGRWLFVKLFFVFFLYAYFLSLHKIFLEQSRGVFRYTSAQLRIWNEVATIFLFAIVFLAEVKTGMSWLKGIAALLCLAVILLSGIWIYKKIRNK